MNPAISSSRVFEGRGPRGGVLGGDVRWATSLASSDSPLLQPFADLLLVCSGRTLAHLPATGLPDSTVEAILDEWHSPSMVYSVSGFPT